MSSQWSETAPEPPFDSELARIRFELGASIFIGTDNVVVVYIYRHVCAPLRD